MVLDTSLPSLGLSFLIHTVGGLNMFITDGLARADVLCLWF